MLHKELKVLANVIARVICVIFERSEPAGEIPKDWKKADIANIRPIFKKNKNNLGNYNLGWLAYTQWLQDYVANSPKRHIQAHERQEGAQEWPAQPHQRQTVPYQSDSHSANTKSNGHRLKERKFQLDKSLLATTSASPWNKLPREAVKSPALKHELLDSTRSRATCSNLETIWLVEDPSKVSYFIILQPEQISLQSFRYQNREQSCRWD